MNNVVAHDAREVTRTVDRHQWMTLKSSLYPGARDDSIKMVLAYCAARGLDPMKKPCHIVPMSVKDPETGRYEWRDVILPGIYELRTTAQKTGLYIGQAAPEFGETIEYQGVEAPSSCAITVKRWHAESGMVAEFTGIARFSECVGLKKDKSTGAQTINERWSRAPFQMLEKCAEAAALRKAFPDELGGEMTHEEMTGVTVYAESNDPPRGKPETQAPQAAASDDGLMLATDKQIGLIKVKINQAGLPETAFLEHFEIADLSALRFDKVNDALSFIKDSTQ